MTGTRMTKARVFHGSGSIVLGLLSPYGCHSFSLISKRYQALFHQLSPPKGSHIFPLAGVCELARGWWYSPHWSHSVVTGAPLAAPVARRRRGNITYAEQARLSGSPSSLDGSGMIVN